VQEIMNKYFHKEAVSFLNDQCWHDSVLYEIRIIRTNSLDQAIIHLDLLCDYHEWESQRVNLIFNDCYYMETKMNGGVSGMSEGEMVSGATANLSNPFIDQVTATWKTSGINLPDLFHFSIILASTGSEIDIVCKSVGVVFESDGTKHNAPPPIYPTR